MIRKLYIKVYILKFYNSIFQYNFLLYKFSEKNLSEILFFHVVILSKQLANVYYKQIFNDTFPVVKVCIQFFVFFFFFFFHSNIDLSIFILLKDER